MSRIGTPSIRAPHKTSEGKQPRKKTSIIRPIKNGEKLESRRVDGVASGSRPNRDNVLKLRPARGLRRTHTLYMAWGWLVIEGVIFSTQSVGSNRVDINLSGVAALHWTAGLQTRRRLMLPHYFCFSDITMVPEAILRPARVWGPTCVILDIPIFKRAGLCGFKQAPCVRYRARSSTHKSAEERDDKSPGWILARCNLWRSVLEIFRLRDKLAFVGGKSCTPVRAVSNQFSRQD